MSEAAASADHSRTAWGKPPWELAVMQHPCDIVLSSPPLLTGSSPSAPLVVGDDASPLASFGPLTDHLT